MPTDEPTLPEHIRSIFAGTERERDVALFRVAQEVCGDLERYYAPPSPAPTLPAALRGLGAEELGRRIHEESALGAIFGTYRDAVLEHEATSARRLDVLRGTCRTLIRLRQKAHEPERLDAMAERLANWFARTWRRDLDLGRDRDWSLRVSRRYDLLPRVWREL